MELFTPNLKLCLAPLFGVLLTIDVLLASAHGNTLHRIDFVNEYMSQSDLLKVNAVIQVDVDKNGNVTWDNIVMPDDASLEIKLKKIGAMVDMPVLHFRINSQEKYRSVAHILATTSRLGVSHFCLNYENKVLCPIPVARQLPFEWNGALQIVAAIWLAPRVGFILIEVSEIVVL